MEKEKITIDEFFQLSEKIEIKTGFVTSVEEIPKAKKLIKLTVDFGCSDIRTVVTNIRFALELKGTPVEGFNQDLFDLLLEGKHFLFVTNLKPAVLMGVESTAMILPGELERSQPASVNAGIFGNKIL